MAGTSPEDEFEFPDLQTLFPLTPQSAPRMFCSSFLQLPPVRINWLFVPAQNRSLAGLVQPLRHVLDSKKSRCVKSRHVAETQDDDGRKLDIRSVTTEIFSVAPNKNGP